MTTERSMWSFIHQSDIAPRSGASVTRYDNVNTLRGGHQLISNRTRASSALYLTQSISTEATRNISNTRALDLGAGDDKLQGFQKGKFIGGSGIDTLELPRGTYRITISGFRVKFTKDGTTMNTVGFEKLKAGQTYDFSKLKNGQTIRY
jgi:hypothetical protein